MDRVIDEINNTGYGLTMGLHSRIVSKARRIFEAANVGNFYFNRDIVGAVVGVQPFGGQGLSGTGPKAGGPTGASGALAVGGRQSADDKGGPSSR